MQVTDSMREYWSKNLAVTGFLLFIWFLVTFVMAYYARELSFNFFGWTFAFWMASPMPMFRTTFSTLGTAMGFLI